MSAKPKVTEELFQTVKCMLKGGATLAKCGEATGLSVPSISFIKNTDTLEKYREAVLQSKRKRKNAGEETVQKEEAKETPVPQVVEHHQTITLIANQYIADQMKKQTELLTLINNKLTLIAEDLGCFRDERISNG